MRRCGWARGTGLWLGRRELRSAFQLTLVKFWLTSKLGVHDEIYQAHGRHAHLHDFLRVFFIVKAVPEHVAESLEGPFRRIGHGLLLCLHCLSAGFSDI